ncbi:hypothetical protein EJ08DRAFT_676942 [Tothia fuscella]|uniref:Uncharacterized protein n=1 Tax=Tothia fuscella TaxID=1048955 RepID=A0A9P4NW65_9PEZI|nr:hypothetical protein EJ08DRAFT_676942 [Tothia fuscella]
MGYSEIPCRICGVSFNISRIRQRGDPWKDAFLCDGLGWGFVESPDDPDCANGDGCYVVLREDEVISGTLKNVDTTEASNDEDGSDYVLESSDDEEPLEFMSDEDIDRLLKQEAADEVESAASDLKSNIQWPKKIHHAELQSYPLNEEYFPIEELPTAQEHIVGPGCKCNHGYNGSRITAEEMRGCNTFQCLVINDKAIHAASDDMDYERESNYFLSGLSDFMPSRDGSWEDELTPARHGIADPSSDNIPWDVNNDGLMNWFYTECEYEDVHDFPHHRDVRESSQQWWKYYRGHEYLAANPLFVPKLNDILASAVKTDASFNSQAGAFTIAGALLTPRDIASLRLASRTFQQLPIILWRRLLRREMPWLWEVWSDDAPLKWAALSVARLRDEHKEKDVLQTELASILDIIKEEQPELSKVFKEAGEQLLNDRRDVVAQDYEEALQSRIWNLPASQTNWYELYASIVKNWGELKGLQNRARIWEAIEEIIRRIKKYEVEA